MQAAQCFRLGLDCCTVVRNALTPLTSAHCSSAHRNLSQLGAQLARRCSGSVVQHSTAGSRSMKPQLSGSRYISTELRAAQRAHCSGSKLAAAQRISTHLTSRRISQQLSAAQHSTAQRTGAQRSPASALQRRTAECISGHRSSALLSSRLPLSSLGRTPSRHCCTRLARSASV